MSMQRLTGTSGWTQPAGRAGDRRPLIAHIVFRFDYGGLENGLVNVVNGLPQESFRHVIIALSEASDFCNRIRRPDVGIYALAKQPGQDPGCYVRLYGLLRQLRPAVAHTRNLGTLEGALVARLAGTRARIHGEHGWDTHDPDGTRLKYRVLRRLMSPSVDRFVVVSLELQRWLTETVGVSLARVVRICNGVDVKRFRPAEHTGDRLLARHRFPPDSLVVGSVTRFSPIKDPLNLVRAFIAARRDPAGANLRLVMAGDGSLKADAERLLSAAGLQDDAWLPGSRDDIPALLREFDVFVLGSQREGISNTVLEAMATGLPVVASATGGNLELVLDGETGRLVPPGDSSHLTRVLLDYARDPLMRGAHGRAARRRAEGDYSLDRMLTAYEALYRSQCGDSRAAA
jgi:sugar transferase (PEP-CTERM/EpsH1 system associated)